MKLRKIRKEKSVDIEPQEVLLDQLAQKRTEELGSSGGSLTKLEAPLPRRILKSFFILILLTLLLLFSKTLQLQTAKSQELTNLAKKNKFVVLDIQSNRGVIYDQNMNQLAFNEPGFDLFITKHKLPEVEIEQIKAIRELAEILNISPTELQSRIDENVLEEVLIASNLDQRALILLNTKKDKIKGISIRDTTVRAYKPGSWLGHVLGYTGKITTKELEDSPDIYSIIDYVGRAGIEKEYEKSLRKIPGEFQIERDALGNVISEKITSLPKPGNSLVLWLDAALQQKLGALMEEGIKKVGAYKGAAVALDPKTGGVLALISLPNFDNNLFQKGADSEALQKLLADSYGLNPLFNRAISGEYAVGSTIKPLLAAAGLEEKVISPNTYIFDQGLISIPNPYYPDIEPENYTYHDWATHGWVDVKKAIAESCNVFFYILGGGYQDKNGLGPTRIKKYLREFGWGKQTGIDMPTEKDGLIPDPNWKKNYFSSPSTQLWRDGDTYNLSIGQGYIAITPLQVAASFMSVANKGILYQPQAVKQIIDPFSGVRPKIIKNFEPEAINSNFIDAGNLEIVRQGMKQTVTAGSATGWLDGLPVSAAAKTGTAQAARSGYFHNWITVFAPYDDPEIVLTIVIEDVKEIRLGALPIARDILNWYFTQ